MVLFLVWELGYLILLLESYQKTWCDFICIDYTIPLNRKTAWLPRQRTPKKIFNFSLSLFQLQNLNLFSFSSYFASIFIPSWFIFNSVSRIHSGRSRANCDCGYLSYYQRHNGHYPLFIAWGPGIVADVIKT